MSDKTIKTKNNDINNNFEKFVKWSKNCIITTTVIGVFGVVPCLLTILKEFTDLEEKAPFLYSKIFMGILLAIFLILSASEIFFYVKVRKYKKQIEESENKENDYKTNVQ